MGQKTIREISVAWKEYKQPYVKQSTMAAYVLILENHILPILEKANTLHEQAVQEFVLQKIENGLNVKSVKDILIVLKMVMKFGVKNEWMGLSRVGHQISVFFNNQRIGSTIGC